MSKTDLEAWLEEVEAYLKLTPENFHAAIDIKYKAIDLLKLVKKQREALKEISKEVIEDTTLIDLVAKYDFIATKALEYNPRE